MLKVKPCSVGEFVRGRLLFSRRSTTEGTHQRLYFVLKQNIDAATCLEILETSNVVRTTAVNLNRYQRGIG